MTIQQDSVPTNILELIKQRRSQMLVHSYLYYWEDITIVNDHQWQRWADELTDIQRAFPVDIGFYDMVFKDWDGSTGCHLPRDDWVRQKALQLVRLHELCNQENKMP